MFECLVHSSARSPVPLAHSHALLVHSTRALVKSHSYTFWQESIKSLVTTSWHQLMYIYIYTYLFIAPPPRSNWKGGFRRNDKTEKSQKSEAGAPSSTRRSSISASGSSPCQCVPHAASPEAGGWAAGKGTPRGKNRETKGNQGKPRGNQGKPRETAFCAIFSHWQGSPMGT